MSTIRIASLAAVGAALAGAALAANGISIQRGEDRTVASSCSPTLVIENRSSEAIDWFQAELEVTLRDGSRKTLELNSAYRHGIWKRIAPGERAVLEQRLDETRLLGAGCAEIAERRIAATQCETSGRACAAAVSVQQ